MKLKTKELEELRNYLETELEKIADGERIKLDKVLLESLIFYQNYGYDSLKRRITFKLPIWTPKILQKIDLSEVSFDNVIWDYRSLETLIAILPQIPSDKGRKKFYSKFDGKQHHKILIDLTFEGYDGTGTCLPEIIDFSNTNAKIDFSNAIKIGTQEGPQMHNCNFENVDLSESHFEIFTQVTLCSFQNCHLTSKNINEKGFYQTSNFGNCHFQDITINAIKFLNQFEFSDLKNTGIRITGTSNTLQEKSKLNKDTLKNKILSQKLNNCYINEVRIKSCEEQDRLKKEILRDYDHFFKETKQTIDEEIKEKVKTKQK